MSDFKLTKLHRWLDKDDTVRFFFMLFVVMLFIVPIQFMSLVHGRPILLVIFLTMLTAGLYIAMTRVAYIQGSKK